MGLSLISITYKMNTYNDKFKDRTLSISGPVLIPDGETTGPYLPQYPPVSTPIKIVGEPNVANNTIVVDGNIWNTGETVTGPSQGATGKFSSATDEVATLTDVTGRWIGYNRLGESFYMAPTTPQTVSNY